MRRRAIVAAAVLALLTQVSEAHADTAAPYRDPAANGVITLCDVTGHVATHGSTRTKPFVWRAVGSAPGVGAYSRPGRTATLFGYQPLRDVAPYLWQGQQLTAGATYSNAKRPMAAATAADLSLQDLLVDYPPKWSGLIQLRMFLGGPGAAVQTATYNAATIRISGGAWTLVQGGTSGCASGTARSSELVLPSVRALGTPAPNATTDAPGKRAHGGASAQSESAGSAGSTAAGPSPSPDSAVTAVSRPVAESSGTSGSAAWPWLLGLAVLAGAAAFGWWRRRPAGGRR